MNLNLSTHHHRLARVGLSSRLSSKLFSLLLQKVDCKNHLNSSTPTKL
ncbi:hypothetical protein [Candidatus Pelagibacter communis]|nr:hypothetical protein [Candidatus Pelagibacter ubique]